MREKTDRITPKNIKIENWKVGTFDLETRPIHNESSLLAPFCMGATYCEATGTILWDSLKEMLAFMLVRGKTVRWYAHNGGGFDFKYFLTDAPCLQYLKLHGWEVIVIGGKIAKGLVFKRGHNKINFCDSAKLMPDSLDRLSKAFKVTTPKGKIDFEGGEVFSPENPDHIQYLKTDVECLYAVVSQYRKTINLSFGTEPKFTASSTAFNCFRTGLDKTIFRHPEKVNNWIHGIDDDGKKIAGSGCYYGGRTEAFYQTVESDITYIDVNSLYPHIMYTLGAIHRPFYTKRYQSELPGFYRVYAVSPNDSDKFGFLPYRLDNGGLAHPLGAFSTCCSNLEIDLAREQGWEIDVIEGWGFEEQDTDLFKPFIDHCKELRQRDYSGGLGITAKFLQNNLYGFFGMKPIRPEFIFSEEHPEDDGFFPCIDAGTGEQIYNLWEKQSKQDTINCIPAFAAWITAGARVYLTRAMLAEEQAGNKVLYCDTDSIFLSGDPVSKISEGEYGAFKIEYTFDELMIVTSKMYAGKRVSDDKIVDHFKAKGLPKRKLNADLFRQSFNGVPVAVEYPQLYSLIRAAKTGILGEESARHSAIPASITNRLPSRLGYTTPIILSESRK